MPSRLHRLKQAGRRLKPYSAVAGLLGAVTVVTLVIAVSIWGRTPAPEIQLTRPLPLTQFHWKDATRHADWVRVTIQDSYLCTSDVSIRGDFVGNEVQVVIGKIPLWVDRAGLEAALTKCGYTEWPTKPIKQRWRQMKKEGR